MHDSPTRLWIGLYLPRLPLEVYSPSWSTDLGSVVLEQERVLAASGRAQAAGVRVGMRRGGALMLMPQLRLLERAPPLEAEALQAVAMALLRFTPLVTLAEEDTLLIDIGASLRLFGGIRALCRLILAGMRGLGFTAMLACAPTARGAWLLARGGAGRVLTMAALARRVDALSAGLLPPARPYLAWFEGIGCQTLGQMRSLPRPGLQRRCGRALLDMLDDAHGLRTELFEWIVAPASFRAKLELFDRVENAEALLFGARRLLLQLTGWLCAQQFAVERISLLLEHERGRVARAPTVLELVLDAPVIGLSLEALQVKPMAPPSESLFPEPGGSKEDRQRLFELLVARLGADHVLQAAPQADYRPEQANAWVSVQQKIRPADARAQLPPDALSLPRPTWLMARPVALI